MTEVADASYYLGDAAGESSKTLDIVIGSGDIVTIDELPKNPEELITFLEAEKCGVKYWTLVAQAYSQEDLLSEAVTIIEKGLAEPTFKEAEKSQLNLVLAWIYIRFASEGASKADNLAKAAKALEHVKNKNDVPFLIAQSVLHLHKDEAEKALQLFDRLLKIDSSNCIALLGKAQVVLNKTQNYANALKIYQQVLVLNPLMKPDPRIGIGLCFWYLKDRSMALSSWQRALEIDPSNIKAKLLLTLAEFDLVFTNSASDESFIDGYKNHITQMKELHQKKPDDKVILLSLASFFYSKGDYDLVEKIINKVITLASSEVTQSALGKLTPFIGKVLSQSSLWLGRSAYAKKEYTQAQKYFHEATRLDENNLLAKLGLAQAHYSKGSTEEAIITYESIQKTHPKCLEMHYSLGLLYAQLSSKTKQEQAIHMLERYIRLSNSRGLAVNNMKDDEAYLNKEPIVLNAFLQLSRLYQNKDLNQSLTYLHKAIEARKQIGLDAPLEVYNNIGVFNFIKNRGEEATENFEAALKKAEEFKIPEDEMDEKLVDLPKDLRVPIVYNLARSQELTDQDKAVETYNKLLEECPRYFSAKLRLLFLDAVNTNKTPKQEIEQEIKALLEDHTSNLEVRSFYGWFIKTFGKKIGLKADADTQHQKETLVQYDSHDCYALISLANIYCVMAKEIKSSKEEEKKKKYYLRAIELYTKVLSIDSRNVFAAQGLAIVYIENNEDTKGLDILRKIRDSLNDISVYLNLGHVLVDMKEYSKAIENYEIALVRFANNSDAKIMSFLGRAWYVRGVAEKNLGYLKKGLEYTEQALKTVQTNNKGALVFNVAYVQFQIAEFISKMPVEHRVVDDINDAILGLNDAIALLNQLALEEEKHPPFPKADLKARANMGTNTLLGRLNTCLEETKEHVSSVNSRLEEAKKLRQEEEEQRVKEEEAKLAEINSNKAKLAEERAKLQEQAQQWAEEARLNIVAESDDDKAFDEESADKKKKGKKDGKKAGKKGKKGGKKKKDFINDSDEEEEPPKDEDDEPEEPKLPSGDEDEEPKREKRKQISDDEDEDQAPEPSKKRKSYKSQEMVEDLSDDNDDLF